VVNGDKYWCLVEQPQGTYRRVEIDTRRPVDGGYVVNHGVATGDPLVVHGTGLLLARMMAGGAGSEE
jgi:multidrug efflux pump subunit AcrA (membrane-fusion protein)